VWWKRRGAPGIRRILMEQWDPVHAAAIPEAADEYDTYVGHVGRQLREGAGADEIASYLTQVAEDRIGLGPPVTPGADADRAVSEQLVKWYAEEMAQAEAS
jgi:hypothetical protein